MCHNKCDIVATLEHGRLVKVEADSKSPRGRVCPRGKKSPEIVYSEKRILHPLIRCGEKGEGRFRRATWDEALTCASRGFLDIIRNYGPQALASYYGGSGLEDSMRANAGLFRVFGSPNDMGPDSICNTSSCVFTPMTTYGVTEAVLVKDIGHSEIIFCWGKNPKTDSGPLSAYRAILEAKERGAKLVVIDPCRAGMGEMADMWVPIIPGSDGALAMAMTKLILERHLYDEGFVKNYTRGFEAYEAYLKTLSVDRLSKCCGIPVRIIEELTRLFLSTEKISLVSYTGLEYQLSGVQNNRAIQILWAITGKVDVEGGIYINGTGIPTRKPATKQEIMPLGAEQYPVFYGLTGCGQFMEFPNAVLHDVPYPIRGLLIRAASPAISYPEQKLWRQVYKKLDFMVVLDRFMTEDAKYADVVLPATTLWENDSFCEYPGGIRLREQIIEPVGEAKADLFIYQQLAEYMGRPDAFPKNKEELYGQAFKGRESLLERLKEHPEGIVFENKRIYRKYETGGLRSDGRKGFPTPSGKFEISSTVLEDMGYTGYPVYKDISEEPGLKAGFEFVMTCGNRSPVRYSSFGPNIEALAALDPYPTADIDPLDAARLEIEDGCEVDVETAFGTKRFRARITPMHPGTIHVFSGGGSSYHSEAWREGNINDVNSMEIRDDISGFPAFKAIPCRIRRA